MHRYVQATLGRCVCALRRQNGHLRTVALPHFDPLIPLAWARSGDIWAAVELPAGEDECEWIAMNCASPVAAGPVSAPSGPMLMLSHVMAVG